VLWKGFERRTVRDRDAGARLAERKRKLTLLFVEEHDPRRYGEIDVRDKLASLVAKQVSATGLLTTTKDGQRALYVHGSDIGAAR